MNHKINPKNLYWVKGALSLRWLHDGLSPFITVVAKRQYEEMKTNIGLTPKNRCRTCKITSLKPHPCKPGKLGKDECPEGNKNCTCTRKDYIECPKHVCDSIRKAIIESEESKDPTWRNIDITRCHWSAWEIQRCFLKGPGYDEKESVDDTDAVGLILIICHNTYFRKYMSCSTSVLKEIREWRKVLFHSGNMELEEHQLKSLIKDIKTVLQDEKELNSLECAKQAIINLEKLENENFMITTEHQANVFRDSIASVQKEHQELVSYLHELKQDNESTKDKLSSVQREASELRESLDNNEARLIDLEKKEAELRRLEEKQKAHLKEIEERRGTEEVASSETNIVHAASVGNLQVGSYNEMYVGNNRKGLKSSRNDSLSDTELYRPTSIPKEIVAPVQDWDPNVLRKNTATSPGTNKVYFKSARNVQVGSKNVMHVVDDPSSNSAQEGLASIPKDPSARPGSTNSHRR